MGHTRNVPEAQPERDKRDRKQSSERRTKENCDSRHVLTSDEDLEQQTAARVLKVQRDTVIMSRLSCLKISSVLKHSYIVSTRHVSLLKPY